jgi:hypothetical protein
LYKLLLLPQNRRNGRNGKLAFAVCVRQPAEGSKFKESDVCVRILG